MTAKQNSPLATYESVAAACESLSTDGLRPSVRAVITRLGGGSPNVVLDFQRQWKAGRPVVKALDIQLDPRVNQIIAEQISKAIIATSGAAEADRAEAEETLDTVSKTCKEAEAKAEALDADLHAATAQVQTLSGQVEQLKIATAQAKLDATATIQAEQLRTAAEVAKIAVDLTAERAAAEAARIALAKAELRLEAVPRIEKEIEQVRAELNQTRERATADLVAAATHSADLHEQAAVAEAKREAAQVAADRLIVQLNEVKQAAAADMAEAIKRVQQADQDLSNERAVMKAAQTEKDHLVVQMADQRSADDRALALAKADTVAAVAEAKKSVAEAAELRGQLAAVVKQNVSESVSVKKKSATKQAVAKQAA